MTKRITNIDLKLADLYCINIEKFINSIDFNKYIIKLIEWRQLLRLEKYNKENNFTLKLY